MSSELDKHLLQGRSWNGEINNLLLLLRLKHQLEQSAQTSDFSRIDVHFYFVGDFVLGSVLLFEERHVVLAVLCGLIEVSSLDRNVVALAIVALQMAWTSITNEATIDHNDDVVTKWLGFVHSVGCQDHWWIVQLLKHFEQAAAWNWVDAGCGLIQEFNSWTANQRHSTYELSLVSSAQIAC